MSSLLGILNTGRLGIMANQTAMAVTGNNISNVNTPGYSRQEAQFQSVQWGGVQIGSIERMRDEFLGSRLRDANTNLGGATTLAANLQALEGMMNETEDSGLSKTMRDFFAALQDLSLNPGGLTERDMVRSRGSQMIADLSGLTTQIRAMRQQLDQQIAQTTERVNAITTEVAELNKRIAESGSDAQQTANNQMLDQRDRLIDELSTYAPLHVIKNDQGQVTVFAAGEVLVEGNHVHSLVRVGNPSNDGLSAIAIRDENGAVRPLRGSLGGGSLGALLASRDDQAGRALSDIEKLAASLVRAVNVQHRAGMGLDGVNGRDFFKGLSATALPDWQNKGGATVSSVTITDDTQLTFEDTEIRFTSPAQFDIVNATTGATLSTGNAYVPGGSIALVGMNLVLTNGTGAPAAGDVFRVNAYAGTTTRMSLDNAIAADSGAIAAGQSAAAGDNRNALALAKLMDSPVMGGATQQTFEDFYQQVLVRVGGAAQDALSAASDNEISQNQIQAMMDAVSGVSIDEEATRIIQFQRAFEASSRVVRATDELMQTILNMV